MKVRKKKAEKALSILLTLLMVLCMFPMTAMAETVEFSDTWDHWAKDSIERWSDYGIVNGMPEGYFNPDGGMTRAQAASVFAKLLNLKPARPANFIDVPTYEWYVDPIARVVAAGIMNGMGDGLMNPEGYVSREQFFVMFARALGIHPQETTSGVPADGSDYSTGYINALTDKGFVKGDENGVNALADISRASVVALLDQTISTYANKEGSTVKAAGSGITLVVADGVTVTGKTEMLAVAIGAEGTKGVTVENAEIGQMNVMADANVELAGDTKVAAISVDISADGSRLTVDKNATVGTIDSEASNSTIENKGTVTGTITTTGEKTDVSNSGSVASIDAKGKNTEVSNTGKVSGNITATGTVNNTGTISGNVAATGTVTNKGKVTGSIAQNGEATKPAESTSGGGGGGGSSSGGGGGSTPAVTRNIYSITADTATNGTVSVASSARDGSTVTVTLTPNTNYKVDTVTVKDASNNVLTVNGTGNTRTFTMPDKAVTVSATFVKIRSSVTVNSPVGGTVSANAASADAGDTVTVTATPDGDHNFGSITVSGDNGANISVSGSNGTYTFTMPPQAVTVAVSFAAKGTVATPTLTPSVGAEFTGSQTITFGCATAGVTYYYTTNGSAPTTNSSSGNSVVIAATTTVKVMAAKDGMVNSAVASATYTKLEAHNIIATPTNGIVVAKVNNTTVTEATSGTSVTLTLTPNDGYKLTTLTVGGNSVTIGNGAGQVPETGGNYTFTMPNQAVTVSTTFTALPATTPTFLTQPTGLTLTVGYGSGNTLNVAANDIANHSLTYQWYSNTSANTGGGTLLTGKTASTLEIATGKTAGTTEYYYCVVTATRDNGETATAISAVATVTVTAAPTYGITVNKTGNGTVTGYSAMAEENAPISLTVTPSPGYSFGSISAKDSDQNDVTISGSGPYTFTMPAKAVTVTVIFTQDTYSLTLPAASNGNSVGASRSTGITYNEEVTLTVTVAESYTLTALTVGGADVTTSVSNNQYSFNVTDNTEVTATFTQKQVATPTFSVAAGAYDTTQSVELSCGTAGATINYTTDGTDPTASSPTYSSAIAVNDSATIKAIAVKTNWADSEVASATYTINKYTATAETGLTGGEISVSPATAVTAGTQITVTVTPAANYNIGTVTYKVGASEPTTITPENGTYKFNMPAGNVTVTATFTAQGTVATPTFSPAAGAEFADSQQITINCATAGAEIHYTTDGSTPTASSATYSAPFTINATTTVKVIAVKAGMVNSAVATATYTKLEPNNISVTAANGTVVAKVGGNTVTSATSGASVTLTVAPNTGYKLTALSINSGAVEFSGSIAEAGDDYTFTMPNEAVTVSATFALWTAYNSTTGNGYDTLAEALTAATDGQIVALQKDDSIANSTSVTVAAGVGLIINSGITLTNEGTITNNGTITNSGIVINSGDITGEGSYGGPILLDAAYLGADTCANHNAAITTALHKYKSSANYAPVDGHDDQKVMYAFYSVSTDKYGLVEHKVTFEGHTYKWVAMTNGTGNRLYAMAENINYFEYFATEQDATDAGFADLAEANAVKSHMNTAVASGGFDLEINLYEGASELTKDNYTTAGTCVSSRVIHCQD